MKHCQPKQFPEYLSDYSLRRKRTTGHLPALNTLRTKEGQLSHAHRAADIEPSDTKAFGALLADRDQTLDLIETLLVTMTTGGVRNLTFTLIDYGEYLQRQGACEKVAIKSTDAPPANPQGPIRTFTPAEVELLITAARGVSLRWFGFIATLAETGRRSGEVLGLEWQWSRLDDTPPHFILPTTKTRRPQAVALTDRLMDEVFTPENIETLKRGGGGARRTFQRQHERYVFPMSFTSVNGQWQRFTEHLGLSHRGGLHKFRHSKATQLLAEGVLR